MAAGNGRTDAADRPAPVGRRFAFAGVAAGAFGLVFSIAVGVWIDDLVRALFERAPWLAWATLALVAVGVLALAIALAREAIAIWRLQGIQALKRSVEEAAGERGAGKARARRPQGWRRCCRTARKRPPVAPRSPRSKERSSTGRRSSNSPRRNCSTPLDREARRLILDASKRVSVVTAVSPRAVVDLAYVAYEAVRLVRAMATLYGGRPGALGMVRLMRDTIAHLAVTGSIAVGDGIVQQVARPWCCGKAFLAPRRRRDQRHDDGANRHCGNGPLPADALQGAEAAADRRLCRRPRRHAGNPPAQAAGLRIRSQRHPFRRAVNGLLTIPARLSALEWRLENLMQPLIRTRVSALFGAAIAIAAWTCAPALARDQGFFKSIAGTWKGPGRVVAGKYKGTRFVCDLIGDPLEKGETGIALGGHCRVGVFSQDMSAVISPHEPGLYRPLPRRCRRQGPRRHLGRGRRGQGVVGINRKQLYGAMVANLLDPNTMNVTISVRVREQYVPVIGMTLTRDQDSRMVGSIR